MTAVSRLFLSVYGDKFPSPSTLAGYPHRVAVSPGKQGLWYSLKGEKLPDDAIVLLFLCFFLAFHTIYPIQFPDQPEVSLKLRIISVLLRFVKKQELMFIG